MQKSDSHDQGITSGGSTTRKVTATYLNDIFIFVPLFPLKMRLLGRLNYKIRAATPTWQEYLCKDTQLKALRPS